MDGSTPARFHNCIAVPNLERSIEFFTKQTGIEFQPARELTMRIVDRTATQTVDVNFAFSLDGRLELLQTVPGEGLFSDETARGFHHIGYQTPAALEVTVDEITATGEALIAEVFVGDADAPIAVFFAPTANRPVRLEILSPSLGSARAE